MTSASDWFFVGPKGDRQGPVDERQLVDLVRRRAVPENTLVWRVGFETWQPFNSVAELSRALPPSVPEEAVAAIKQARAARISKLKSAAGIAAVILVGGFVIKAIVGVQSYERHQATRTEGQRALESFREQERERQRENERAATAEAPVVVRHPFDRNEFFVFPAGTRVSDAKAQVIKTLTERAEQARAAGLTKIPPSKEPKITELVVR